MSQQRDVRHAAAKAFFESLDYLEQTLEPADEKDPPTQASKNNHAKPPSSNGSAPFDLASLEDAIADIDQFIQQQEKSKEE